MSVTNPYSARPLYVAQANPANGRHVRAFFFLGSVPRAVLAAARRGRPRADPRVLDWTPADAAVLRAHYGQHWRDLLTAQDPPESEAAKLAARQTVSFFGNTQGVSEIVGGAFDDDDVGALNFGDLGAIDSVEDQSRDTAAKSSRASRIEWPSLSPQAPVFLDIAVHPEDSVRDLMLKLAAAAEVPTYRQHLFFYINEEGPTIPYRVSIDGAPVVVDWRALTRLPSAQLAAKFVRRVPYSQVQSTSVAGISIDPRNESRRDGLRVEARDSFTSLVPAPGVQITRAYYVDLFATLPPLETPERPNDGLASVLKDSYQLDLLYYGAIILFWPQLSPDAALTALTEPSRIAATYPALEPDPAMLRTRFSIEREVADLAAAWRGGAQATKSSRATTAVTAATVRVRPDAARMRVAIRNVFDWVKTTPSVPASVARFDIESSQLEAAVFETAALADMRGGKVPVTAMKRHASSYGPRSATTIDWFVGRLPRRDSVAFAVARTDLQQATPCVGTMCRVPYAFMTVHSDGRYDVAADWREDDRVGFEEIAAEIAATASPLIAEIGAMGAAAFPIGGTLATLPTEAKKMPGSSLSLGGITVSAFWPHALPTASFRELKNRFRRYEKAGIVSVRGLQQAGAYTFSFRKGVVSYDARLSVGLSALNQYAWLTDPTVAAQWSSLYHGRTIRIFHRSTDLRVEILAADSLSEFELIRRYVFSFLDSLLVGSDRLRTAEDFLGKPRAIDPTPTKNSAIPPGTAQRLRRLQERDPNLYDLKKYGPNATVYSVLCQSGRQPSIYNATEAAKLPTKRREQLTQYWNFTEHAPAYYECGDPRYPYLSFRAGQHPLGYFLPCCKMTRAPPGSRAALVNEQAAALKNGPLAAPQPDVEDEDSDLSTSRHVLTYGKTIPVGRVADTPREVSEGLFLDAIDQPYKLFMIGVEQTSPAVTDAGFAYSVAYLAGEGDTTGDDVLRELAAAAAEMGDTYYALGGGAGAKFESAAALADTILGAFVRRDPDFSQFGPGGDSSDDWRPIMAELVRYVYGIEIVYLSDADGTGSVTIEAPPSAAEEILREPNARVALVARSPGGTYPLAALDPKFFLRAPLSQRWMAARRTFGPPDSNAVSDRVAAVVRRVLGWKPEIREKGGSSPTFDLMRRFCDKGPKIEMYLANARGLCYALILTTRRGKVYFPVQYSVYPMDDTPVSFGPRPAERFSLDALDSVVAELNAFITENNEPFSLISKEEVRPLVDAAGMNIGFCAGDPPLYYYHDPVPASGGRQIRFPYDSRDVDTAIKEGRAHTDEKRISNLANAASARNRLYRLFLAEFSAVLRSDRNAKIRTSLEAAIRDTKYDSAPSMTTLRSTLSSLLGAYPEDLMAVRDVIVRALESNPNPKDIIMQSIGSSLFSFDRRTLIRLRAMATHSEVVAALRVLMAPRILVGELESGKPSHIFVSCGEQSSVPAGQCSGKRLVIPPERIDDFYDILAADVRNPGKTGLLSALSAGVFDPLDFQRRPGERLTVTLGAR